MNTVKRVEKSGDNSSKPSAANGYDRQAMNDAQAHTYDIEVEKSVIGVLLDGRHLDAYGILCEFCPDLDAFYHRDHKIIVLAIHEVAASGEVSKQGARVDAGLVCNHLARMPFQEALHKIAPVDQERRSPYTVRAKLAEGEHEESALAAVGGLNVVSDLASGFSLVSSMRRNCELLARYLRQRRAIAAIAEAQRRLLSPDGSNHVEAITADTMNTLTGALGKGRQIGGVALGATEALARHDEAAALRLAGKAARIGSWGVPMLDETCPLAPGRLVLLAALPGGGKTSLLLQAAAATRQVHSGDAVRLVSWEIPRPDLAAILLAREVGVSRKALDRGWMQPTEREKFVAAQASWAQDDIPCIFSGPDTRLGDITAWIRLQHRLAAGRLLVVGVDYVQKLPGPKVGMREYERVSDISSALMDLKNQLGICILALCQFSRDTEKNATGKVRAPRASDLRGSGSLEQDADAVVILHPVGQPGDVQSVDALIVKNRGYSTYPDGVRLDFHKRNGQTFAPPIPVGEPDPHSSGRTRYDRMENPSSSDAEPFGGA